MEMSKLRNVSSSSEKQATIFEVTYHRQLLELYTNIFKMLINKNIFSKSEIIELIHNDYNGDEQKTLEKIINELF